MYGGIWTLPSSDKACFLCVVYVQGASKHMGHPNIQTIQIYRGPSQHIGGIQIYEGIQTYGGTQMYGAYGHSLSLTKHAFFVLCMYRGHPNIWGTPIFGCLLNMCGHSHMFGRYLYAPLHTQHKKACFVTIRGVPMPHTFGCPICLMAPCMFECPICVDTLVCLDAPYIWMLPICLDTPVCLDGPYVWTPPVCLDNVWIPPIHTQHKKACFVTIRGFHMPPTFGCPICLDGPRYV